MGELLCHLWMADAPVNTRLHVAHGWPLCVRGVEQRGGPQFVA